MIQYSKELQIFTVIAYSIIILLAIGLKFLLKNKKDSIKEIPLNVIGIIIIVLEINKQVKNCLGYHYRLIFRNEIFADGFQAYALPFHFCSFFIFWIIFKFIFFKNEKLSMLFKNMAFLWSALITFLMVLYPGIVYGDEVERLINSNVLEHTVVFHFLVAAYFAIACALRTYRFKLKDIYYAPIGILIFGALAIPAAHIFKENYCAIYKNDGWSFLDPIFNKGYVIYNGLLVIVGIVLSIIAYLIIILVEKLRDKIRDNNWYSYGYIGFVLMMIGLFFVSKGSSYEKLKPLYSVYLILLGVIAMIPANIKDIIDKKKMIQNIG